MPELAMRKFLEDGLRRLRQNKVAFDDLFYMFTQDELNPDYGEDYREQIWNWFIVTKIPVVQAWSFNAQRIPCISIHLANETEAEDKAAMNDYFGGGDEEDLGVGVFTVMIDIGIHANKGGDHVLWMYYIVSYLLMKYKTSAERLGMLLGTFSASDYSKDAQKMGNNVWTRWVRFRCTTQNSWGADPYQQIDEIDIEHSIGNESSPSVSVSGDMDIEEVDPTANEGLVLSRKGNESDDEDVLY